MVHVRPQGLTRPLHHRDPALFFLPLGHLEDAFNQSVLQPFTATVSTVQCDDQLVWSSQVEASHSGTPQHSSRSSQGSN